MFVLGMYGVNFNKFFFEVWKLYTNFATNIQYDYKTIRRQNYGKEKRWK